MREIHRIAVYCGSADGVEPAYLEAAAQVGQHLAEQGVGLVYGGGSHGLMGSVAASTMKHGGHVTGVIPEALMAREGRYDDISDLRVVQSMHERKMIMAELSDGFVALPGGFGTLEELLEVLTWQQLGIHAKPIAVLNVLGFFDPLLNLLDHATQQGFISPSNRSGLVKIDSAQEVVGALQKVELPSPPPFQWNVRV